MNRSDFGKKKRKIPPCGRLIEYSEPHSPFQKLIDERRKQFGLSGRDLAERIGVSQSTLRIWLHNLNGYPHPKSFKPEHLTKISEALKIPEAKLKSALDASRRLFTPTTDPLLACEAFDPFDSLIGILENDPRKSLSKSYVINLAKNLLRGAKVTLGVAGALIALQTASALADGQDTLITVSGKQYDKVRVTEVTPVTIAFKHSTGVARLPFTDFGPDVQKKYGYDAVKANAWLVDQAQQDAKAEQAQRQQAAKKGAEVRRRVDAIAHYLDDGGHVAIDPHSGLLYDPDVEAVRRREAFKFHQRYGYWPATP